MIASNRSAKTSHSHHIMPTAANLLGFTFIVLTSMKALGISQSGVTDKATGLCVVLFALSTLLSFLSIRSRDRTTMIDYEKWANRVFVTALVACTIVSVVIAFDTTHLR